MDFKKSLLSLYRQKKNLWLIFVRWVNLFKNRSTLFRDIQLRLRVLAVPQTLNFQTLKLSQPFRFIKPQTLFFFNNNVPAVVGKGSEIAQCVVVKVGYGVVRC